MTSETQKTKVAADPSHELIAVLKAIRKRNKFTLEHIDDLIATVEAGRSDSNRDRKTGSDVEEIYRWSRMAKEARRWHESTSTDRRVTGRRLQRQIIKQNPYSYFAPGCRTPEIIFGSNLIPEDKALYAAIYTLMYLGELAKEISRTNRSAARQILEVRNIAEGVSKRLQNGVPAEQLSRLATAERVSKHYYVPLLPIPLFTAQHEYYEAIKRWHKALPNPSEAIDRALRGEAFARTPYPTKPARPNILFNNP